MTIFNSTQKNVFHYITIVAFRRTPIFKSEIACQILIDVITETRKTQKYKLIAYVIMPDHVHLIVNPAGCDISAVCKSIKGISSRRILDWLRTEGHHLSLKKLELSVAQKRNHTHAVWQKGVTSIDLWSPKFILQKSGYIHMNPVRAGLSDHPAKWRWSSYGTLNGDENAPIKMDRVPLWNEADFE
ncbi:MAG TPA: hypothetical protein DEP46_09960 [Blastocatellia bacterium]|nr:hypothetical protein [Blastocatellia bacterium]